MGKSQFKMGFRHLFSKLRCESDHAKNTRPGRDPGPGRQNLGMATASFIRSDLTDQDRTKKDATRILLIDD